MALALSGLAGTSRADVSGKSIDFAGTTRRYLISVPSTYSPEKRYPLLLVFHGGGGNAKQVLNGSDIVERSRKEGWILVAPDGNGRVEGILTWNVGFGFGYAMRSNADDIGFVRHLITSLKAAYSIDPDRVYATGISNGGILCHLVAAHCSDQIAAIAPIVATAGGKAKGQAQWTIPPAPKQPVSVIAFNGALDQHIPVEGGLQKKAILHEPVEIWSVKQTDDFWVQHDRCGPRAIEETDEAGQYKRYTYRGGIGGSEVVQYILLNQGHAWPGGKRGSAQLDEPSRLVSANDLMFEFFKSHPKERSR